MYGKLLRQFTMNTGTQQKQVAAKLKYSPQRVGNYYRDIAEPPFEFLEGFRKEFGVDLRRQAEAEMKGKAEIGVLKNPIPVFDLSAKPSKDVEFFKNSELATYYIDIPFYNDCYAGLVVSGKEMSPVYNPSDIIAIKAITDMEIIPFGAAFLILTEEQRLVRYIYESGDKKSLVLRAANDMFGDITIKKDKIKYLFQVKGKMSKL